PPPAPTAAAPGSASPSSAPSPRPTRARPSARRGARPRSSSRSACPPPEAPLTALVRRGICRLPAAGRLGAPRGGAPSRGPSAAQGGDARQRLLHGTSTIAPPRHPPAAPQPEHGLPILMSTNDRTLPSHVALILDGNGRWAAHRG